jgi:hypothetical protein
VFDFTGSPIHPPYRCSHSSVSSLPPPPLPLRVERYRFVPTSLPPPLRPRWILSGLAFLYIKAGSKSVLRCGHVSIWHYSRTIMLQRSQAYQRHCLVLLPPWAVTMSWWKAGSNPARQPPNPRSTACPSPFLLHIHVVLSHASL